MGASTEQAALAVLMTALLSVKGYGSMRDITDVSIIEDGVVQLLLSEEKCDFQIDVLTVKSELRYLPRPLKVRECTTIVVIRELRGPGVLLRFPSIPSGEVIYTSIATSPGETKRDVCRGKVDEAVDLCTPFVHGDKYIHPAKIYISHNYSWLTRTLFCNDNRIQPTSCSNVSCSVSSCVTVVIPEMLYLYTAYHEETCNTDSSNDICEAIQAHFNGTEWYRQDVARHCVAVTVHTGRECLPNCKSLYNATERSTVHCNFTSGQCSLSINQTTGPPPSASPHTPPPPPPPPHPPLSPPPVSDMTTHLKHSIFVILLMGVVAFVGQ